jgi:osmotically-inducible protein OsmY
VRSFGAKVERVAENATLAAKVKAALATRKGLKGTDIHVDVNGSVVTLKGDVNTRAQATEAVQVAKGTAGVTSVNNQFPSLCLNAILYMALTAPWFPEG